MSGTATKTLQDLSNIQLVQKNKAMEQLLARVAHELLTPITSLILTSDDMLDHFEALESIEVAQPIFSNKELLVLANRMVRSASDLKNQAMGILNHFSNANSRTTLVNVQDVVNFILDELAPLADRNKIKISTNLTRSILLATEEGVRTILRNVLSNAVKFTAANTQVKDKKVNVNVTLLDDAIRITIEDTGIGMPSSFFESEEIFELGRRSSTTLKEEVRGYGLGMTTTKSIMDSLGGTISFKSTEGKGTTVTLLIPKNN